MMLSTKMMVIGVVAIVCLTTSFVVGALTGLMFRASLFNLLLLAVTLVYTSHVRRAETVEQFLRENLPPVTRIEEY